MLLFEMVSIHPDTRIILADAFSYCLNLKELTIPKNVILIQDNAFYQCDNLETVYYECNKNVVENSSVFLFCNKLKNFVPVKNTKI